MSVKHIRWSFIGLLGLVTFLAILLPAPVTMGASSTWTNGNYRFAGGTHPAALVLATLFTSLYFALMVIAPPEMGGARPGVVRRFFAFWLDFIIAMMVIGPTFGILATIAEWRWTGIFVWMFERETTAPTDILLTTGGALLVFVLLLFYFVIPLVRRRPSPGSCITGYQIISDAGESLTLGKAISRTILGFVAMSMWPLTPFIARQRKKGKVWFDGAFSTHAVILR
jgi:RDD family protein